MIPVPAISIGQRGSRGINPDRDWRCLVGAPGPYWSHLSPWESPVIAKRKPPSQRPELKMDETATAIARLREEAKTDNSEKSERPELQDSKSKMGRAGNATAPRKAGGGAPSVTTRRPKTIG